MKSRSAGYRIAGIAGLILVGAAVVIGALMLLLVHIRLTQSLDAKIAAEVDRLVTVRRDKGRNALLALVREEEENQSGDLAHAIFDSAGRRVAGDFEVTRPVVGWSDAALYDPIEGSDPARVLAATLPGGDVVAVASGRRPVDQMNELILWQFAGSILVVTILSALLAVFLGRYLKARLQRISTTADAIIAGDLSRRVALTGTGDEFDRIAISLNAMLDRIAALVAGMRRVSSDVAHDIKTPLTRLRARTERTLIQYSEPSVHRDAVEHALEQIDEVLHMFDAILRIAEIEEGGAGPRCERFRLSDLVEEVTQPLIPVFEEEGRELSIQIDPLCVPCGDRELLGMAIINLLENVLRHTPPGTDAALMGALSSQAVEITVSDHGPGLPAPEHDLLFARFYRADAARGAAGHGLGLSLVAAVMKAHQGNATARDNDPGLAITLVLPERC